MMDAVSTFFASYPVFAGILTGGVLFGVPAIIIGWGLGHDRAMTAIDKILNPDTAVAEAHGDVPYIHNQVRRG